MIPKAMRMSPFCMNAGMIVCRGRLRGASAYATGYELVNNAASYGIGDDVALDVASSLLTGAEGLKANFDAYVAAGAPLQILRRNQAPTIPFNVSAFRTAFPPPSLLKYTNTSLPTPCHSRTRSAHQRRSSWALSGCADNASVDREARSDVHAGGKAAR